MTRNSREYGRPERRRHAWVGPALAVAVMVLTAVFISYRHTTPRVSGILEKATVTDKPLVIHPDYTDLVIPPNIASLNFQIRQTAEETFKDATRYCVRIGATRGRAISIESRSACIRIPERPWRRLLAENPGETLTIDIGVRRNGSWERTPTFQNTIAAEAIDPYIVYRQLRPNFNWWRSVGVYQRSLEGFGESVVLHGETIGDGCVNCHTFRGNDPKEMLLGIRGKQHGSSTLLARDGKVDKIGARWGYAAWHPDGEIVAYAVMKVRQFFHRTRMEVRDVVDLDAAILYCNLKSGEVKTNPALADNARLETYPAWTPDGTYLYFCSAPIPWSDRDTVPPKGYNHVRYDLRRVRYEIGQDRWGEPETVLAASVTGKSILQPRFSPDGRFLLFCMCEYGCFPVFQESSDLYMMDMTTGKHERLAVNSRYSESWHSWSSNSRWIAFSSKRRGGLFTRPYLSYVDSEGKARKPFVLPQADATFYDSHLETYSVPELITAPIPFKHRMFTAAVRSPATIAVNDALTRATPKTTGGDQVEAWEQAPASVQR